jgi:DNA polymerase IV
MERAILHLDIPAFPIAVERVVTRRLRERPVAVAPSTSSRAPILSCSLEARQAGVFGGMPVHRALRICHELVILPPNEPLYRRASEAVLKLLSCYSPLLEPAGSGHVFVDMTGTRRLFGPAVDAASRIRREMRDRLRLVPTLGVGANKLVSRVAARIIRPDGLCDVLPGTEAPFLAPLPIDLLPDARGETRERFEDLSIVQVGDLLALSLPQIRIAFGWRGDRLYRQAQGIDDSPVRPPEAAPAVVEEEALDSNQEATLARALWRLCERAGARLRRLRAAPRRLRVTVRYADATPEWSEARLPSPTAADLLLFQRAGDLLDRARARRVRVSRVELRCFDLVRGPRQLTLFGPEAFGAGSFAGQEDGARRIGAAETLAEAADRIRNRFGERAIVAGRLLEPTGATRSAAPGTP